MQAVAAELSGCAGEFRCFLERRVLKQFVLIQFILKQALKQTRSVFLRAF
jgi:hypothetical protein